MTITTCPPRTVNAFGITLTRDVGRTWSAIHCGLVYFAAETPSAPLPWRVSIDQGDETLAIGTGHTLEAACDDCERRLHDGARVRREVLDQIELGRADLLSTYGFGG